MFYRAVAFLIAAIVVMVPFAAAFAVSTLP